MVRVMPGVGIQPGRGLVRASAQPLNDAEHRRAVRAAERLHADLGRLVEALPEAARHASGMSRHLGIVRNTCQRVVAALQDPPGLDTLAKLPGVKGLDQFLVAMAAVGVSQEDVDIAETAVRAFEAIIDEFAGSHAKLAARLHAQGGDASEPTPGTVQSRAALYEAAASVMGRALDTHVSVYAFRHAPGDEGTLERALAHAQVGSTIMPGGMPVTLTSGNTLEWIEGDARDATLLDETPARGRTQRALLEPFTTRPLPTVTSRGEAGKLVQLIDPAQLDGPTTFDVATAERSAHPARDANGRPTLDEVWTLVNAPTRRLVFDVYIHASIERLYRPSADALLWYPNLSVPGGDRWITRFPAQPKLELLGRGLDRAGTERHARHRAFTRFLFDTLGWPAGEFVGFRVETDFPIWRAGYCIRFDHVG